MSSLEFAAREKVNQLAVLANFSSWRSEQAHDVCLPAWPVPAYLLRTGNRASSHADYVCAERLIESAGRRTIFGEPPSFSAPASNESDAPPPLLLNAESERLVMTAACLSADYFSCTTSLTIRSTYLHKHEYNLP